MNKIILELINQFSNGKINKEQLLTEFSFLMKQELNEDLCLKELEEALVKKDSETINQFISVGFIIGFSHKSLRTLCKLLLSPIHYNHEDIARLLQQFKSPETVDCLYKAAELQFDYLDYDDTYQFARKCIKALSAIGNDDAIDKLRLLAGSKTQEIAEYAKTELRYKELL